MKERKETIIQVALAISAWTSRRGKAFLRQDEQEFKRCDKILDYWLEHLERKIKEEGPVRNKSDIT